MGLNLTNFLKHFQLHKHNFFETIGLFNLTLQMFFKFFSIMYVYRVDIILKLEYLEFSAFKTELIY